MKKNVSFHEKNPLTSYKLDHDKALIISPKANKRAIISNKKTTVNILMKVK